MDRDRLIELESLCAAATDPPWTDMLDREHPDHHLIIGGQSRDIADVRPWMTTVEPDARFIAESRVALPEALRAIRDLQRDLAAALRERDEARQVAVTLSRADGSGSDLNAWMAAWERAREWAG